MRVLVIALGLWACSEDAQAPLTPGGGPGHEVGVNSDAGTGSEQDDDAGASADAGGGIEGPMRLECMRVEPLHYTDDVLPSTTATSEPLDFTVTRQAATWRGVCSEPKLVIALSDGNCPLGGGHELEITLDVNAIENGVIAFGLNEVLPESDALGIGVRYVRPEDFDPEGQWGNCIGSGGLITFYDAPDVSRATNLRFTYDLDLSSCDDRRNAPLRVSGFVDVRVRRSISEVCPTR